MTDSEYSKRDARFTLANTVILVLVGALSFLIRDLPFLKYGFLYCIDSLGHFWFSKIIVEYGYLYPAEIKISYAGDTGWFTGYAPYFGQHILQAIASILTGIKLEKIFFNLNVLISTLCALPIYLIVRAKTKNQFKAVASLILTSFWFYFVFYSWLSTYEIVAIYLFLLLVYLTEKKCLTPTIF